MLNEKAAQAFGWDSRTALGKRITWDGESYFTVKGVVKDFNFSSLHKELEPVAIVDLRESNLYRYMSLRLSTTQENAVANVEQYWKEVFPDTPFNYFFLDSHLDSLYQADRQGSTAASLGTFFLLIVIVLGLISLLSFSIIRRKKETAIRKILGASPVLIFRLLITQFIRPLFIALFVATAGAYIYLVDWLGNFAFRIDMPWVNFLLGGAILVLVIVFTTILQGSKAVLSNPVKSIKDVN